MSSKQQHREHDVDFRQTLNARIETENDRYRGQRHRGEDNHLHPDINWQSKEVIKARVDLQYAQAEADRDTASRADHREHIDRGASRAVDAFANQRIKS